MPRVEEEIIIRRPPEDVFAFTTAPENDRLWSSTAVERRVESEGPVQVGTRIKAVDKFLGRRIESTFEVTEHEPNRRSAIKFVSGPFPAEGTYTFEPAPEGTRFRWSLQAPPGLGGLFLGRVTDPLVTRMFRRRLQRDLRRLKDVLEGGRSASA
jgi:ligand-binding SRPBCC domain-containing protein